MPSNFQALTTLSAAQKAAHAAAKAEAAAQQAAQANSPTSTKKSRKKLDAENKPSELLSQPRFYPVRANSGDWEYNCKLNLVEILEENTGLITFIVL